MIFNELIASVAKETYCTQKEARDIICLFFEKFEQELITNGRANLPNIGTLEKVVRSPREGHNVNNLTLQPFKEKITIKFIPSPKILEKVSDKPKP